MRVYLGLGANQGDRHRNLRAGIDRLCERGLRLISRSPTVESPALLPRDAIAEWNRPFLNLAIEGELDSAADPEHWRGIIKEIEDAMGRDRTSRWAPRPLDIDILLWGNERIHTHTLDIPHRDLLARNFVLTPLVHLNPCLRVPGFEEHTVLDWSRALKPIPLWMGIVNLTPDSFSDAGAFDASEAALARIARMVDSGVHIIDLGAESTGPGAAALAWETEWSRLAPVLRGTRRLLDALPLAPKISIDTRHPEVAERAMDVGIDLINDVSALGSPGMQRLARDSRCEWVVVHHLSVPANPRIQLPPGCSPAEEIERWLRDRTTVWAGAGIDTRRLLLDPGIGFGKDSLQSLQLLRDTGRLREAGLRLVVGHSRKSFLHYPERVPYSHRDLETIGASLSLCQLGADVLRVHDVEGHARAYRAWAHVQGFPGEAEEPVRLPR